MGDVKLAVWEALCAWGEQRGFQGVKGRGELKRRRGPVTDLLTLTLVTRGPVVAYPRFGVRFERLEGFVRHYQPQLRPFARTWEEPLVWHLDDPAHRKASKSAAFDTAGAERMALALGGVFDAIAIPRCEAVSTEAALWTRLEEGHRCAVPTDLQCLRHLSLAHLMGRDPVATYERVWRDNPGTRLPPRAPTPVTAIHSVARVLEDCRNDALPAL